MSNLKPRYNEIVFSDEEVIQIIDMYSNQKMSTVRIGSNFGCSHKVIAKLLEKNNIKRVGNGRRKYNLNEQYFDIIDNPTKAYILGFLFADGNVNLSKQTVSMSLQEDDYEILERIRNEIGSENKLKFLDYSDKHDFGYHYKNQYRMLLHSKYMCNSLIRMGMFENKSLILEYPKLPKELNRHFIRGYFDGDGSVTRKIKNENNISILLTITSTEKFCKSIKEIAEKELGIKCGIYEASSKNGITKVFSLSKSASIKFMNWMYKDADIYIERKYKRYIEYIKSA